MNANSRGRIITLVTSSALGATLAGGAVALASCGSADLGALARLPGGVSSAFDQDRGAQLQKILAGLVSKGTITQAQADAILGAVKAAQPSGRPAGPGRPGLGFGLDAAATYLNITPQALGEQLRTGKGLAEIAAATTGKTRDGLISAENARIDQAVTNGRLTAEAATAAKAKVAAGVAAVVDHKAKAGPPNRPNGPRPFGAPKPATPSASPRA